MPSKAKSCETCHENPATVHLTEMANNHVVLEKHLCDQCASKQGIIGKMQMSLVAELLGNIKDKQKGAAKEADVRCPDCGMLYSEFRAKARFGCSRDYDVFQKHVLALLEKIHGSTEHVGKRPKGAPKALPAAAKGAAEVPGPKGPAKAAAKAPADPVAELEKELEKAVKGEDFERAAKLRDRIREAKARKEGKE
ncbi:MAG: UvrB/UvrC motif-containing protein [Planctomycetia bacterium]|nr:UvrB/UvrC motif-containing protein [Planctomycetia bacterium]